MKDVDQEDEYKEAFKGKYNFSLPIYSETNGFIINSLLSLQAINLHVIKQIY